MSITGPARLPSISNCAARHELGGLMSYGPDLPALLRCAGQLMYRMLEGAKPADIAHEQGTKLGKKGTRFALFAGFSLQCAAGIRAWPLCLHLFLIVARILYSGRFLFF